MTTASYWGFTAAWLDLHLLTDPKIAADLRARVPNTNAAAMTRGSAAPLYVSSWSTDESVSRFTRSHWGHRRYLSDCPSQPRLPPPPHLANHERYGDIQQVTQFYRFNEPGEQRLLKEWFGSVRSDGGERRFEFSNETFAKETTLHKAWGAHTFPVQQLPWFLCESLWSNYVLLKDNSNYNWPLCSWIIDSLNDAF